MSRCTSRSRRIRRFRHPSAPPRGCRARPRHAIGASALLLIASAACAGDDAAGGTLAVAATDTLRREPAVIAEPAQPYRVVPVVGGATIAGTVRVTGDVPTDTTVRPAVDARICGTSFVDHTITRTGDRLGGVVLWLTDVRSGAALPLTRRFDVRNLRCQLVPRVQAVVAGGTLNVRSADALVHRTRVLRQGTGEVVARYEHNDFGQVIPDDALLDRPGLLELRSEVHPWTRGFVAVFDHPYFDVSEADGAFTIADVPPGDYTLAAWHERFGRTEQRVSVAAGAQVPVTVTFGAGASAAEGDAEGTAVAGQAPAAQAAGRGP